jgi:hypothetical protein
MEKNIDVIRRVKSIIFIIFNLGLEGLARLKLLASGKGQTQVP